jgi:general secretion pathway protein F
MTHFRFEAARSDGASVHGTLDAASLADAAALVSRRGLFPLAIEEARTRTPPMWRRPSLQALATVFQGLAALLEAGVPLEQSLRATERSAPAGLRDALARVSARIRDGASLGAALGAEHGLFPALVIGLVRAGERGLGLAAALCQAALQLERQAQVVGRIRAALAYPAIVAVVGTASVLFIVGFVVPRFAAILGDLGQELPLATRALVAMSELLRSSGLVVLAALLALGAVWGHVVTQHRARWHRFLLAIPIIGPIRHALASARITRTLGALLSTGSPALVALSIAEEAAGDDAIAERVRQSRGRVSEGAAMSNAFAATDALTPEAIRLTALGEGSGRLAPLLAKSAELDERTAERRTRMLVMLLEPALIVGFAGLVAFVAGALLQAVYAVRP